MKTIKQAAKEYADTKAPVVVSGAEIESTIDDLNLYAQTDFEAGAKFAQQWVSVNDELPAVGETVLLKFGNNEEHVTTGIYIKSFHGDCAYQESGEQCTHWRPIERE